MTPFLSSGLRLWEPLGPGAPGHERTFPLFIPPQYRSWHQPLGGLCSLAARVLGVAPGHPPPSSPLCVPCSPRPLSAASGPTSLQRGGTSGGLVLVVSGEHSGWAAGAVAGPPGVERSAQRGPRLALPVRPQ